MAENKENKEKGKTVFDMIVLTYNQDGKFNTTLIRIVFIT